MARELLTAPHRRRCGFFHILQVKYESNGDLKAVRRTSSRRARNLQAKEQQIAEEFVYHERNMRTVSEHDNSARRLFACSDCVDAWDAVCDEGVPSVCALIGYSSALLPAAVKSIETTCGTFGSACSMSGGKSPNKVDGWKFCEHSTIEKYCGRNVQKKARQFGLR